VSEQSPIEAFLEELATGADYRGQIQHLEIIPARPARYDELDVQLSPRVEAILDNLGLDRLYRHQVDAIKQVFAGKNVVIAAGTASGKTLCYTVPLAQAIHEDPTTRAILVYPTKALAQDQLNKLSDFGAGEVFTANTYDGDTPQSLRRRIRQHAQVILTNPDMLHMAICPYHESWADFLGHLKYVVLDEVHTYRGVFGSHTANVLRRLRRIAQYHGAEPQFICSSATVGNPGEHCQRLVGLDFEVVSGDTSARGRRFFVFWNPPLLEPDSGQRRSGNMEAAKLTVALARRGIRTLTFTQARQQAELILQYMRELAGDERLSERLMAYRGGYLPEQRREIEQQLFSGDLLAVAATSALELGVDIGSLDAVVMTGYPGSISSAWQQVGRAGRGQEDSLAVLVALPGGIDQYVIEHPGYLLDAVQERVLINPDNRFILGQHLLCAAYELPLAEDDECFFGPQMPTILQTLEKHNYLRKRRRWHWAGDVDIYPPAEVNIRSTAGGGFEIIDASRDELLGTIDETSVYWIAYPGAVYLHQGEDYLVTGLDLQSHRITVEPTDVEYYTRTMEIDDVDVIEAYARRQLAGSGQISLGEVNVHNQVVGYRKFQRESGQQCGSEKLNLPAQDFETIGMWLTLNEAAAQMLAVHKCHPMGSLHALEHALVALLPLFSLCEAHDIGGVSYSYHKALDSGGVFIYDGYPGGVGICEEAYYRAEEVLGAVYERITSCPCEAGCPSCIQSPSCGDDNQPLDKAGAALLAQLWVTGRIEPTASGNKTQDGN